jgi:arsenite methyltransferase
MTAMETRVPDRELKLAVRRRYASAATRPSGTSCCGGTAEGVPKDAQEVSLGCGSPTKLAAIAKGEVVVDLGSGGGIDVFAAANELGGTGRVIGVDATLEMILRARETAKEAGYSNVEFRLGEIENLPLERETADLVISNCVLNLVPDKPRAFQEIFRVLKPGGRMVISDIVTVGPLPKEIRDSPELWSECVSGAVGEEEIRKLTAQAGLVGFDVLETKVWGESGVDLPLKSLTFRAVRPSATIPGRS